VAQPRSNLRWVFALLLLGGVVAGGIAFGQGYFKPKGSAATYDARVDSFVQAGQQALRRGDLDGARQQFEQASALAANHPDVLGGQLLVLASSCDRSWLELRLLPDDATEGAAARTALSQCTEGLKTLSDRAASVEKTPELSAVLVDALRL